MKRTLLLSALTGFALTVSAPVIALPAMPLNAQALPTVSEVQLAAARFGRQVSAPRIAPRGPRGLPPSPCRGRCRR